LIVEKPGACGQGFFVVLSNRTGQLPSFATKQYFPLSRENQRIIGLRQISRKSQEGDN
jgi:hypothetical protein